MNRLSHFQKWVGLTVGLALMLSLAAGPMPAAAKSGAWLPDTISNLAEKTQPGVVNIRTVRTNETDGRVFRHFFGPFGQRPPRGLPDRFRDFFGPFNEDGPGQEFRRQSLGSGFVIDRDGYIVTNNHVVEDADEIKVRLSTGEEFEAEIVGRDPKTDLALIRIDSDASLTPLPLGDSEDLKVGEWVVAIGSPFGLEQTVTAGIVSAKGRVIGAGPYDDFIQTDASINPGNSGGPLLSLDGKVVGINTAIVASGQGIGFAIPINLARTVADQLKESGEVSRGWLGVGIQDITDSLEEYYNLESDEGVLVTEVYPDQPAERGGIESGDVIVKVDGKPVEETRDLSSMVANLPVGKETAITVIRDGKRRTLTVTLGKRADGEKRIAGAGPAPSAADLGLELTDLTPQLARRLGVDTTEGTVVSRVMPGSKAHAAGFRRGDLILEFNRKPISDAAGLKHALGRIETGETARFLVRRPGSGMTVLTLTR